jgi:hypothetical protein
MLKKEKRKKEYGADSYTRPKSQKQLPLGWFGYDQFGVKAQFAFAF